MQDDDDVIIVAQELRILAAVITKHATQAIEQRLTTAELNIGPMQFGLLRLLRHGPQTISELSQIMLLSPGTLVPAVDALERSGLVLRSKDPRDRRRTPLVLTDEGAALLQQMQPVEREDVLACALAALTPDERHRLLSLMRMLVTNMPNGAHMLDQIALRLVPPEEANT